MENNLKQEQLNRTIEVLNTFGAKVPEKLDYGVIYLLDDENNETKNYIEFDDESITIYFERDDFAFYWNSVTDIDGIYETLEVDGTLNIFFSLSNGTSKTSELQLYDRSNYSPTIHSDLFTVRIDENKDVFGIESYPDLFNTFIESKKSFLRIFQPDDQKLIDIIIKLYESPIKRLVYDLQNNDQSWRFTNDEARIMERYNDSVEYAYDTHNRALIQAAKDLRDKLDKTKDTRDKELYELEELHKKFNSRKSKIKK